ncbi:SEC14-like protein 2 [Oratosquilla oratoria]|uniref:SEC14-like protein 2 n=1 Tax=Oratosquilla oratoria TaxID=337810 RepID=UPI003F7608EF
MRIFGLQTLSSSVGEVVRSLTGGTKDDQELKIEIDRLKIMTSMTLEQKDALEKFRNRVAGLVQEEDNTDERLLQWLVARNFNVDKAENMLTKSLDWRREWDVDNVLSWNPPEVLLKYYPVGMAGHDKEGRPVWIIPYGGCDMRGLLQSVRRAEYVRYTVRVLERSRADMREQSRRLGRPVLQQSCVFDLHNFSVKHVTWKPAMDVILQLVQIYEANYPELLHCAYVINAPKIFTAAYAIIRPFLHEVTLRKIRIFGKDGWKQELLKDIDPEELPQHWGGSRTDPDGNGKCPSQICLGGEVPKSYYLKCKSSSKTSINDKFTSVLLEKGCTKDFEFDVTQAGSQLRWKFYTEDFDISFGVSRQCAGQEEPEVVVPFQRVNSQLVTEEGCLYCTEPGKYIITFDNQYSYMRSKTLFYNIEVLPPTS